MKQFDRVTGYFKPKIISTLKEEMKPLIGNRFVFEAYWLIDKDDGGPYVGQWAMMPLTESGERLENANWVPTEDIEIIITNK